MKQTRTVATSCWWFSCIFLYVIPLLNRDSVLDPGLFVDLALTGYISHLGSFSLPRNQILLSHPNLFHLCRWLLVTLKPVQCLLGPIFRQKRDAQPTQNFWQLLVSTVSVMQIPRAQESAKKKISMCDFYFCLYILFYLSKGSLVMYVWMPTHHPAVVLHLFFSKALPLSCR